MNMRVKPGQTPQARPSAPVVPSAPVAAPAASTATNKGGASKPPQPKKLMLTSQPDTKARRTNTTPSGLTQGKIDKYVAALQGFASLKINGAHFAAVMDSLGKSGSLPKQLITAFKEAFLLGSKGASSAAIGLKLSKSIEALGKNATMAGRVLTILNGAYNTVRAALKGDWRAAFAEAAGTLGGCFAATPMAVLGAIDTILVATVPGYDKSVMQKMFQSLDIASNSKKIANALVETFHQLRHLIQKGDFDIKSLDTLVENMRKGCFGPFVALGEMIGDGTLMGKASDAFAGLWLAVTNPQIRLTPSLSGKISSVMSQLGDQLNSKDPAIRAKAQKLAKAFLPKLIARAKADPSCRKGLNQWYGYLQSTKSQHFGKYRKLIQQFPQETQKMHTNWRNSFNFFLRMFISSKAPKCS